MKKSYDSKFKSRAALKAVHEKLTVAGIEGKYQGYPNQYSSRKRSSWKELPGFSSPGPSEKKASCPGKVYLETCNRHTAGYSNSNSSVPIFP